MRLKFRTEGGFASFPGLRTPVEIDTSELREEEAARLLRCVEEARFFELPEESEGPPPGAADLRLHTITVEEGARSHTVRAHEPIEDTALRELVEVLGALAKEIRKARRAQDAEGGRT